MKTPFLWTNDDITFGQTEQLQRQLDMLDDFGIPGTFFLIPQAEAGSLADDAELLRCIESAKSRGHEFYQHGYVHDAFECGVPELWMLDFSPPTRQRYDDDRLAIEAGHTFEAQVRMLESGQRIWRAAFGESSPGFRPGWGAFCTGLYQALEALGYQWVSSRLPCQTSWLWNMGKWDAPMHFRDTVQLRPDTLADTSLWELPISGGDYGFRVPEQADKIAAMVQLGIDEFAWCHERAVPFNMVSHWHGLEFEGGTGYAVHRELLRELKERGQAEFMATSTLFERVTAVK